MNTVLISGANKGIGFALAEYFGKAAWHVLVAARNESRGKEAVASLVEQGYSADFVQLDLSNSVSINQAASAIQSKYPDINLLINNAGIPGHGEVPSYDETLADLKATMQVNFFGTFEFTQLLTPILEKNTGRIVNVTIPTGPNPYFNPFAYKATKAAQNVMMQAMTIDFTKANKDLEIFSVHPGPTTTDLNGNMSLDGFHTPADVAAKIGQLILDGNSHSGEFIEIYPEIK